MHNLLIICAVIVLTSSAVFAGAGGVSHGNAGHVINGATPPGLQNKDTPPGLNNLEKTPPGWNKGKKTGWSKTQIKQPVPKVKPNVVTNPLAN